MRARRGWWGGWLYDSTGAIPSGAAVYVHEATYTRDPAAFEGERIPDTRVGDDGCFTIDSVPAGIYFIEVNDGNASAACIRCTVAPESALVALPPDTLRRIGTIRGKLVMESDDTSTIFIQICGLDRIARLDALTDSFTLEDVPGGSYTVRILATAGRLSPITIDSIVVSPGRVTGISFVYERVDTVPALSRIVRLNTTEAGAGIAGDVYDFPVLIRLDEDNFDFSAARGDGSDVRFTKSDGDPLPFEIERWDAEKPSAEIWVLVDTVRGDDSMQHIILLWGVAPKGAASDGGAVFDTARGMQAAWHLGEAGGDTVRDATINGFFGIPYGMSTGTYIEGIIGYAQRFDGASSYIAMPTTADSRLNFPENGYFTLSAWVLVDTLDDNYHAIVTKSNQLYGLSVITTNSWEFFEFEREDSWKSNQAPAQSGSWKHVVGVSAGEKQFLYVDGECVDSVAEAIGAKKYRVTTDPVTIGKRTSASIEGWFSGLIDEVRIANSALSADWIRLCYMNQRPDDALVEILEK